MSHHNKLHTHHVKHPLKDQFKQMMKSTVLIGEDGAQELIDIAQQMNEKDTKHTGGCLTGKPAHTRGTRNIARLVNKNPDRFDQASIRLIQNWVSGLGNKSQSQNQNMRISHTDMDDLSSMSSSSEQEDKMERSNLQHSQHRHHHHGLHLHLPGHHHRHASHMPSGGADNGALGVSRRHRSERPHHTHRSDATRDVENIHENHSVEGSKKILDFTAKKPTYYINWFPMRDTGDLNNLYASGGALQKYDQAFGKQSRSYELQNNYVQPGDEANAWFGHCNNASEVAVLLPEPKRSVSMNGVEFSVEDIKGLLCKVSDRLASRVDFKGDRYYGPSDDPNDPSPQMFLQTLQDWSKDGLPFVVDTDPGPQVWNYPYDHAEVFESQTAPQGISVGGDNVKYYDAFLSGTGYTEGETSRKQHYKFWIRYDGNNPAESGWITHEDNMKPNPDFLWRPVPKGDLMDGSNWTGVGENNPQVDASEVFQIYRNSI